jgi:hypothetical protein
MELDSANRQPHVGDENTIHTVVPWTSTASIAPLIVPPSLLPSTSSLIPAIQPAIGGSSLVSRVIVVPANSTMSSSGMHEANSDQDPPNDQVIKRKENRGDLFFSIVVLFF